MKNLDLNALYEPSDEVCKKHYKDIINQALEEAGSRAALAKILHCDPPRISEWKSGRVEMGGLRFIRLIMFIIVSQKKRGKIPIIKIGENEIEISTENGFSYGEKQ